MKNNKSLHEDFELLTLLKGNFIYFLIFFFLELKFLLLYLFIYFYPGFSFITF
jgi:hypothetical protein